MELRKAINQRHSIRSFESKTISKKIIKKLITNASKAPSAKNEQPWRFYVAYSKKVRDVIAECYKEAASKFRGEIEKMPEKIRKEALNLQNNMGNCPHIIFVFTEKKENAPRYQFLNDIASISCAIENLMLSAVSNGLGTCWIGTFKEYEAEIKQLLKVPETKELVASILIGYPKRGYKPLIREKRKLTEILKII